MQAFANRCKGVILSACNTLIYRIARKKWAESFPNAVIIGTIGRIPGGIYVANALTSTASITKGFWLDPQAFLDSSPDRPREIAQDLAVRARRLNSNVLLAMIYKKQAYLPAVDEKGKTTILVAPYDYSY